MPFFVACDSNYANLINLYLAHGIGNATIQSYTGLAYAYVTAYRGREDILGRLIRMDKNIIFRTNRAVIDPLSVAAYYGQRAPLQTFSLDMSLMHLSTLQRALLILSGVHETFHATASESAGMKPLSVSFRHANIGDPRKGVPVQMNEIIRDYRLLCCDSDATGKCCFCGKRLRNEFYAFSICRNRSSLDCQDHLSVLSIQERLEDFGQLRRLGIEVRAVLKVLWPIAHQDTKILERVLS